ncbi:tRNA 2-thiouridine(34) synthase MnmA, partial [Gemmatimonadota bacterium]
MSRGVKKDRGRVAVAMSGGVDSSLAALLLAEEGYEVIGFTLLLHDEGERGSSEAVSKNRCCGSADMVARARQAALKAGGHHHVIDGRPEFEAMVISDFVQEYAAGRTPNPCVRCNTWLKWGFLREKAGEFGAHYFATGHYARVVRTGETAWGLTSGVDPLKDQSYALWGIPGNLLATTLLPIGA